MTIRIVRLGSPRAKDEGVRIGTVRRPPRGVPKAEFASRDFYDIWYPMLSPAPELVQEAQAAHDQAGWDRFVKHFRKQMSEAEPSRTLDLLAALSHQSHFAIGCYCEDEAHCHRSVLRQLLAERGADLA
ncbi:uncharacterized protein YeaO (DUF488 family) [Silvimonas terrae]|uniref:Uncharacterized protein YeaO (DUF488 family) n=1 Tax=Silvimonas terrae TaxID=300266 RepID=A0A840RK54_9NEIS|nr:DUF488 family protein [Silvimonas terrae]MBB5192860.1 uncharacterized protein YeaO (DUF488 family) [Silvimonas terrae]